MNDSKELARYAARVNRDNGFAPATWETLPTKLMFIVSELGEVRDSVVFDTDDFVREELADVAIRLLSTLVNLWGDRWDDRTPPPSAFCPDNIFQPIEVALWLVLEQILAAMRGWRQGNSEDVQIALEIAFKETCSLLVQLGHDPRREIESKIEINKTRGKWHGHDRDEA